MIKIFEKLQAILLFAIGTMASCVAAEHGAPNMSWGFFLAGIVLAYISMVINRD